MKERHGLTGPEYSRGDQPESAGTACLANRGGRLLKISQPKISALANYRLDGFSAERRSSTTLSSILITAQVGHF
jgi:hypothetical protein